MFTNYGSASRITRSRPDYDGYANNCQNFVRYLLEFACCDDDCESPMTIQDLVEDVMKCMGPRISSMGTGTGNRQLRRGIPLSTYIIAKIETWGVDFAGAWITTAAAGNGTSSIWISIVFLC